MLTLQGLHNDIETLPHVNPEQRATSISLFNLFNLTLLNALRLGHALFSSRLLVEEELNIFSTCHLCQTT
jgi:hypothetical protein